MAFRMVSEQKSIEREQLRVALEVLSQFHVYANEPTAWILINTLEAEGKAVNSANIREAFARLSKGTTLVKNRPNVRAFFENEAVAFPYRESTANELEFASALETQPHKSMHGVFQELLNPVDANGVPLSPRLSKSAVYENAWREFKGRHTDVQWGEAIVKWLDGLQHDRILNGGWLDEEIFITADALEQLLSQLPENMLRQHLTPEAEAQIQNDAELQALRVELLNVKQFRDDKTGRMACFDENGRQVFLESYMLKLMNDSQILARGYRERIESASLEELRAIRDRRTAQRSLQTQTVDQLRATVKKDADANRQALADSRYAPIPAHYTPHTSEIAERIRALVIDGKALWSAKLLQKLPSQEIHRLFRMFGAEAVNSACGIR